MDVNRGGQSIFIPKKIILRLFKDLKRFYKIKKCPLRTFIRLKSVHWAPRRYVIIDPNTCPGSSLSFFLFEGMGWAVSPFFLFEGMGVGRERGQIKFSSLINTTLKSGTSPPILPTHTHNVLVQSASTTTKNICFPRIYLPSL